MSDSPISFSDVEAANKHFCFSPMCGGCYRKIHKRKMEQLGFLCADCKPRNVLYRDDIDVVCNLCQYEYDCTMRVSIGAWTRCEAPDAADIKRLMDMEEFNDPDTRSIMESALAEDRNRPLLEAAVSKVAAKVHQSRTAWRQRKVS
jgi:hypothetical protein